MGCWSSDSITRYQDLVAAQFPRHTTAPQRSRDLLTQPFLDHWPPRHQAESHAVIEHRVAPAGQDAWPDNHKRVYRPYQAEGLSLRLKLPKRNKSARRRQPKQIATAINQIWSMDFVADALFDGRHLRALTVVDNYTRESLAIDVGQNLKGDDVELPLKFRLPSSPV